MEPWLIFGGIALILLVILYLILQWCFRQAFYFADRKKHVNPRHIDLAPNEEFCRPAIYALVDELEARSFERVEITSHDGLRLCGKIFSPPEGDSPDGLVVEIIFNGWRGSAYRDGCGACHTSRGFHHYALLVDQRAHGDSEGNVISFGINEKYDCAAWVDFTVKRFGPSVKILLKGVSMGAATVIMASSLELPSNVRGIVADCAFSSPEAIIRKVCRDMGISDKLGFPFIRLSARLFGHFSIKNGGAVEAVKHTNIPLFLAHGVADGFVPFEMGREIFEACASTDKVFFPVEGAGHGLAFFFERERYEQAAMEFQQRVLAPEQPVNEAAPQICK